MPAKNRSCNPNYWTLLSSPLVRLDGRASRTVRTFPSRFNRVGASLASSRRTCGGGSRLGCDLSTSPGESRIQALARPRSMRRLRGGENDRGRCERPFDDGACGRNSADASHDLAGVVALSSATAATGCSNHAADPSRMELIGQLHSNHVNEFIRATQYDERSSRSRTTAVMGMEGGARRVHLDGADASGHRCGRSRCVARQDRG
jgi:hypothetical protein